MGMRDERPVEETKLDLSLALTIEGEYSLTVMAVNSVGEGPASSPVVYQLNNDPCKVACGSY